MLHFFRLPPGPQVGIERYSLVYFTRPSNSVILSAFIGETPLISKAVSRDTENNHEIECTTIEWLSTRMKSRKIENMKVKRYLSPVDHLITGLILL